MDALLEAAVYRYDHMDEAMAAADTISQLPAGSCDANNLIAFNYADYKELFKEGGKGYEYMKALYDLKKGNIPEGATPKAFEDAFNDKFIVTAIKNYK